VQHEILPVDGVLLEGGVQERLEGQPIYFARETEKLVVVEHHPCATVGDMTGGLVRGECLPVGLAAGAASDLER
jgi:hypothetical protein